MWGFQKYCSQLGALEKIPIAHTLREVASHSILKGLQGLEFFHINKGISEAKRADGKKNISFASDHLKVEKDYPLFYKDKNWAHRCSKITI